jgi:hypothetical protein
MEDDPARARIVAEDRHQVGRVHRDIGLAERGKDVAGVDKHVAERHCLRTGKPVLG